MKKEKKEKKYQQLNVLLDKGAYEKLNINSWRVQPHVLKRFLELGNTGFKHARASGSHLKDRWRKGDDGTTE